jgi:ABC-2 type transport system permease protein
MNHVRREFVKILLQKRTYLGWAGLFVVPFLITIAVYFSPGTRSHPGVEGGGGEFYLHFIASNGLYVSLGSLFVLSTFLLPLLAAMSGSQTLAGEADRGTLRTILMQPVRRGAVLSAKWFVAILYIAIGLAILLVGSLAAGGAFFGLEPLILLSLGATAVGVGQALWLILLAYLFALVAMAAAVSLAMVFSSLTDSGLTAVAAAMVTMIIMLVLGSLPSLAFLRPYLFTYHFQDWVNLFRDPIVWTPIRDALITFAVWIVGMTTIAWLVFRRKDIHS